MNIIQTNKNLLNDFMQEVWNQGGFSNLDNFVNEQYHVSQDEYDPWSNQVIDHKVFKQRVLYSRNGFPDLNFDIQQMTGDESCIAIRWIMSGTHKGDLPMLTATGRSFSVAGMAFYHFENGKLSGHSQCFDQFSFIKQMGLMG